MPIQVRPATRADLPDIARLSDLGFRDHEWSRAMYPVHDSPGNIARYLGRQTKAMDKGESIFFVAIDTDRTTTNGNADPTSTPSPPVIGYSRWEITHEQQPASVWDAPYEPWPVPEGARVEANEAMAVAMWELRRRHYHGAPMVLLNFLVVEPGYQRRGVGGLLLEWGLAEADRLGLPSWLESTNKGYGLYASRGYQPVEEIRRDFRKYGVEEPCVITFMRRPVVGERGSTAAVEA